MNINPIVRELLRKRGVCDEADVLEFLSDSPKRTYNPFLLDGMEEAVNLISAHIKKGSKICIYGDYDTDGVTSVTLMMTALSKLTDRLTYYIPSRFGEGYGLNSAAVERIRGEGTDLIITVDCGSVSYEETRLAKSLGMDIIVTDHHTVTDKQADCILLNPKKPESGYPFDGLAGVGVAFKLVQAMVRRDLLPKPVLSEVLDLVAIGTIGDIVPLVDENRTIVKYGLRELKKGKRAGLKALAGKASINLNSVTSDNIAYIIVPHINAAGRIEDATIGVQLLTDNGIFEKGIKCISRGAQGRACGEEKAILAAKLSECNKRRKELQEITFRSCVEMIEGGGKEDKPSGGEVADDAIILYAGKAHEGITGIVAGKLKDKYYRPTMIVTDIDEEGTMLKGTGRSVEGVNLYELLKTAEDLFVKFGGHKGACGFSLPSENLEPLKSRIAARMEELKAEDAQLLERKNPAEMELDPSSISVELAKDLALLSPFGAANPSPVFEIRGLSVSDVRPMGADGTHARFNVTKDGAQKLQCVLFGRAKEYEQLLSSGARVDIAAAVEENVWNGRSSVQLMIKEIKEHIDD
jgi:single-stranded-DNA-specific exonuclease